MDQEAAILCFRHEKNPIPPKRQLEEEAWPV